MFYYIWLLILSPFYVLVSLLLHSDQARQLLLVQQQLVIAQRQLGKKPSFLPVERLAVVLAGFRLPKKKLAAALVLLQPETFVGWHRGLVRRHWTFRSKRSRGRPPVTAEATELVLRLARENLRWGYGKLAGEMRKLGFVGFGRSTVARLLQQHGFAPRQRRQLGLGWLAFIQHYQDFIWASDFCTVTAATLRTYYIIFVIEIGSRRITYWNVSEYPGGPWVLQQFRNLSIVNDQLPKYLIHDRDGKYVAAADTLLRDVGIKIIKLPARSPDLNAYAERWIRTLREECLDRIIILNATHLRWVLSEFIRYYNERRPHYALKLLPPHSEGDYPDIGKVMRRQILGGLVNDYYREAA